jgi:UDPglucose 6-dehydrogenase
MKIAVIGTGYVGLVAGACFAESGNDVVCVDKDGTKVRMLRAGRMPIYEPGLEELVRRNRHENRLTFTTTLPKAVRGSTIVFIAALRKEKMGPPICSTCSTSRVRLHAP